ncbi:glycosyltransferase family A protein [Lacinutrix neustonica]|uniref:Glycosyltransferase family A protein n=1 Tax=Lacinutrix neustonica TaxID=2980107 RepID=A0A9E8MUN6_9FLAO|nr:glycosyltransferase family A protein [Lacinutrix neustonica]WAC01873.1 glycosyltransferase family A protein [Lacinutrix neustonica]
MSEITVIMPVYNGAEFREASIDSVLNQTFKNFKFLILNDNSTDKTADILDDYQKKDSRIQVIHKTENKGPAHLRNEGIALAKTEFIALIDADDIALPSRFEKQVSFLINNPDYGVCGTWFTFFGDKKNRTVKHQASHEGLKVQMLKNCCIGNPTVMLRKSHLGDLRFENEYVPAEDYRLWSQLIAVTKFHNIQESLLLYRWHPNNISQTKIENLKKVEVIIKEQQLQNLGISLGPP